MKNPDLRSDWFRKLRPGGISRLFEHLPHMLFFAKDLELRLMAGNRAFIERCGLGEEDEIIGRSDNDIFPPGLAEKYRQDDRTVLDTGRPMLGIVELFPNPLRQPEWFITDKIPLFDRAGRIAGLCGTVRSYEGTHAGLQPYLDLVPVTSHLKKHFTRQVPVGELARIAGMSVRQLERRFKDTFKTTPRQYVHKLRILEACELLTSTRLPVTEIALHLGYYDHSAFSRTFSKLMGRSPREYRGRFARGRVRHDPA